MKIQDLSAVNALWKTHEYWSNALHAYQENGYKLRVSFQNNGGTQITLDTLLALDLTKDGAMAALTIQALQKQIKVIEADLAALGVRVYEIKEPQPCPIPAAPKRP